MNKFYRYIFVSILIWSMTIATNIFIIPKNIFAVDRVATFPIFEKASAYNGLAVNPIRKGSSRAYFGFTTGSASITRNSDTISWNGDDDISITGMAFGYDGETEKGYFGGAYGTLDGKQDSSYSYGGYTYSGQFETKKSVILFNAAIELNNDVWLGGFLGKSNIKVEDKVSVSTLNYSSSATHDLIQMGIFGNVKIDNELQAGWRVALPASSEQSYDGDLWSSSNKSRAGNGFAITAGIGKQSDSYVAEFSLFNESEEKGAAQGQETGFMGLYEVKLDDAAIGAKYSNKSESKVQDGSTNISRPIDLTEIQIEVGIYLSETMVGSLRLIKTDGTYGDYGSSNDDLNKPKSFSGQEFSIVIGGAF